MQTRWQRGDIDIFVISRDAGKISWLENDGTPSDGGWSEHAISDNYAGVSSLYLTDVDGDGIKDVLGASAVANTVNWWKLF